MEENKRTSLTRRDALKTLVAITGAATLASLPARWQTPLVQVGSLPVHAQGSAGVLNLIEQLEAEGECPGDLLWVGIFGFNAPAGIELMWVEWEFTDTGDIQPDYFYIVEGDEFGGTLDWRLCIDFDASDSVQMWFYFEDQRGFISNIVGPIIAQNPFVNGTGSTDTSSHSARGKASGKRQ